MYREGAWSSLYAPPPSTHTQQQHPHPPPKHTTQTNNNTSIYSAAYTGDTAYKTMSGTSMATPAVAGAVACVMAADLSATCANTDVYVSKLSNPQVCVFICVWMD